MHILLSVCWCAYGAYGLRLCGWTSLHLAALKGHLSVVERLLEVNANLEAVGMGGWEPRRAATEAQKVEVL